MIELQSLKGGGKTNLHMCSPCFANLLLFLDRHVLQMEEMLYFSQFLAFCPQRCTIAVAPVKFDIFSSMKETNEEEM